MLGYFKIFQRWFYMVLVGYRVIFSKNSHFVKIFKSPDTFSQIVWKLCMLRTIPSQGCQLSLSRTFWFQNELPKSFCSWDRILPKYGHGHFLTFFSNFWNLVCPPNIFAMMSSNYSKWNWLWQTECILNLGQLLDYEPNLTNLNGRSVLDNLILKLPSWWAEKYCVK